MDDCQNQTSEKEPNKMVSEKGKGNYFRLIPLFFLVTALFFGFPDKGLFFTLLLVFFHFSVTTFKVFEKLEKYWTGILFSLSFFYLVFRGINFQQFFEILKGVNYLYIFPAMFLTVFSCFLQTLRWKVILKNFGQFTFFKLFSSVMIGHLGNHILPAKAGEFIKCFHFGTLSGIDKVSIFSTVVVERLFDGILFLSFFGFFILGLSGPNEQLKWMAVIGCSIYGSAFLAILILFVFKKRLLKILKPLLPERVFQPVEGLILALVEGLSVIGKLLDLLLVIILSGVMWGLIALSLVPLLKMFSFNLPFFAPFAILSCICLGMTLPSAPGGLGVISLACVFSIKILSLEQGIPFDKTLQAQALAFSMVTNFCMIFPEIVMGSFFALRDGFDLTGNNFLPNTNQKPL